MAILHRNPANYKEPKDELPPSRSGPLLSVQDLETRFFTKSGTVNAVNGVSFDLARGERMAIVGESGSGKSVMSMSLIGLVGHPGRVTHGEVNLNGRSLIDMTPTELNKIRGNGGSRRAPLRNAHSAIRQRVPTESLGLASTARRVRASRAAPAPAVEASNPAQETA